MSELGFSGVVKDIIGILLLILGLVMRKRAFGSKVQKETQEQKTAVRKNAGMSS